ncbi:MAG: hypothetical protein ABW032_07950 [Burkholderiaceae bacterium]
MTVKPLKGNFYDGKQGGSPLAQKPRDNQAAAERKGVAIRLGSVNNSDSAVVANYVSLNPSYGMVFVDFGFLEPSMVASVQQLVRDGKQLPDTLSGKLSARIALGYDVVASLHAQLGQLLESFQQPEEKA